MKLDINALLKGMAVAIMRNIDYLPGMALAVVTHSCAGALELAMMSFLCWPRTAKIVQIDPTANCSTVNFWPKVIGLKRIFR